MKNFLVLHTGGTISMSENDAGEIMPNESNPLNQFQLATDVPLKLTTEGIFNLPSPQITPNEMLQIQQRILQAEKDGVDGVVITHGTDTLEETAYFLDLTLPSAVPVVLTGAMRSSNEIGSDGMYNCQSAIRVAASDDSRHKGVLVVMND